MIIIEDSKSGIGSVITKRTNNNNCHQDAHFITESFAETQFALGERELVMRENHQSRAEWEAMLRPIEAQRRQRADSRN